ncbi:hypothetical protein [Chlorella virus XW01]|nr:hypothetical protein [Chlorella virus XW01]
MDIEKYINLNKKYYYNNLVKNLKNDEKIYVNNLIKILDNKSTNITNINILTETEKTEDDYLYKKPWNRLNMVHKIIKIKEFVNSMNISLENKNSLIQKMSLMIKNKKLQKVSDVEYNQELMKIISINCLSQDNQNIKIT